jgi:membrane-anchored protein YejM (alkaline phosphatase superfamily)
MALHLTQQWKNLSTTTAQNVRKMLKDPVLVEGVLVVISAVLLLLLLTTLVEMYISYNLHLSLFSVRGT